MKAVGIRVRAARASDVARILEIERSWDHLSHWSAESYARLVGDDQFSAGFVAELETPKQRVDIIGFVIFHASSGLSEIYNIAVEKAHSRCGVGSCLIRAAIDGSVQRAATRLLLEVRKSNLGAIAFYKAFGFVVIGERLAYYSNPVEDAYVMELRISSPTSGD